MSATRTHGEKLANDFYPTPAWATRCVAPFIQDSLQGTSRPVVYEPGAGDGAILDVLLACSVAPHRNLRGCELRDEGAVACRAKGFMVWSHDWLKEGPAYTADIGVYMMNPPYGGRDNTAQKFVQKALERSHVATSVWALLRMNWLIDGEATHKRRSWLLGKDGPGLPDLFALPRRPSFTNDGKADATTYAWMRWTKGMRQDTSSFQILKEIDDDQTPASAPGVAFSSSP